jgi:hypothetical protein
MNQGDINMIIRDSLEKQALIKDIWSSTLSNGGYTSHKLKGRYILAIKNVDVLSTHTTTFRYFANTINTLDLDKVGTWVDDNYIHVDLVASFNCLILAKFIGLLKGEKAIYDRLEGKVIEL